MSSCLARLGRRLLVIGLAAGLLLFTATGALHASIGKAAATKGTIRLALVGNDVGYAQLYVAQARGFFEQAGIHIKIVTTSSTPVLSALVSGDADLALQTTGGALAAANQGVDTKIIYTMQNPLISAWVATSDPNITSVDQCKKVASLSIGSGSYSNTLNYKKAYRASFGITAVSTQPTIVALVASKQADCGVTTWNTWAPALYTKQVRILVDPSKDKRLNASTKLTTGTIWGVSNNLNSKRDLVAAFLKGLDKANRYLKRISNTEAARLTLAVVSDFRGQKQSLIARAIRNARPMLAPSNGYLASKQWNSTLQFFKDGGLSFIDSSKPKFSFSQRVDMSYYNKGIGKPK